jgi:hypothetical protein
MVTVGLVGQGVVGERIVTRLPGIVDSLSIQVIDPRRESVPADVDAVVLAMGGGHAALAELLVRRGVPVVSVSDDLDDVRAMLDLDDLAREHDVTMVVGAGMSPGLTGLLARMLADQVAECDEIHIAVHGTAGPSCARANHGALSGRAIGIHDGGWIQRPAGSGREQCWFPEPVGAYDCYRAARPAPLLLHRAFPNVARISERVSANRRDRFTAWLPMLSPPHREGGVGAVRIEVRGAGADGMRVTKIVGVAELVGTAAAATAGAFVVEVLAGRLPAGTIGPADDVVDTIGVLQTVGRLGVRLQEFTGVPAERRISANP